MARSYLGIVTDRGLESLVPETEHAEPFLLRQVTRKGPTSVCCWAVMSEAAADEVRRHVCRKRYKRALAQLNAAAEYLGTILPQAQEQ